jgi:asparagine synthase (glutamine-hydrolysing)
MRTLFGGRLPPAVRRAVARLAPPRWTGGTPAPEPWLVGEAWQVVERGLPPFEAALERDGLAPASTLGRLCRAHVQTTNLPMLLHYEDRNSMAHGVEARVPFLDHRLVELSVGLGDEHKMAGAETKRVLREAMRGILPELVRDRRDKLGFGTPEREWFRGALRGFVTDGVEEALRRFPGCFRAERLRTLAAEMLDGRREVDFTLWRVVSLGAWARVFGLGL